MTTLLLPLHMGALHAYEQWLAVGVAVAPFLVLAVVIVVRRRQDAAEEAAAAQSPAEAETPAVESAAEAAPGVSSPPDRSP